MTANGNFVANNMIFSWYAILRNYELVDSVLCPLKIFGFLQELVIPDGLGGFTNVYARWLFYFYLHLLELDYNGIIISHATFLLTWLLTFKISQY